MKFEKYRILPSRLVGSGENDYDVFRFDSEDEKTLICFLQENKGYKVYDIDMRNYQLLIECKNDPDFAEWLYLTILTLSYELAKKYGIIKKL